MSGDGNPSKVSASSKAPGHVEEENQQRSNDVRRSSPADIHNFLQRRRSCSAIRHRLDHLLEHQHTFHFEYLNEHLEGCISGNLDLHAYILIFHDFQKLFQTLARVFSFIVPSIITDIETLVEHDGMDHDFRTIQELLDYEWPTRRERELDKSIPDDGNSSGRITVPPGILAVLRLHRGLEFAKEFIPALRVAENETHLSTLAYDIYKNTLGRWHIWLVRQGVHLAVTLLPTKRKLYELLRKPEDTPSSWANHLDQAARKLEIIYKRTQSLYELKGIHNTP